MDDLKQEIDEIEKTLYNNRYTFNKFEAIVNVALKRGELTKLFSADDSYVCDRNGKLWLKMPGYFRETYEPIAITAIFSAYMDIYRKTRRVEREKGTNNSDKLKEMFVNSFKEMVKGTPEQFYWAVNLFTILSKLIKRRESPFYSFGQKTQFDDELRHYLTDGIENSKIDLKTVNPYFCRNLKDGLWEFCIRNSKELEQCGAQGFLPKANSV